MAICMGNKPTPERRREYQRRYLERHPNKREESLKKYNTKSETKTRVAKWIAENYSQYAAAKDKWAKNNFEYIKKQTKKYRSEHHGWMAAHCAKRRAKKLYATPKWLTKDDFWLMEEAYHLADLRTRITGIKWNVDHVIPLQNKKVCGLHVPWNLQVIPASENFRKHNYFEN